MDSLDLDEVRAISDAVERARRASDLVSEHQAVVAELSQVRRGALEELVSSGLNHTQIAERVGLTRARVGQLLAAGPRPERALFGTGPLTIVMGGKLEAGKATPGPVVSAEMVAAYELLSDRVRTNFGFRCESEVVPPPGMVELNRGNLVVMGSPRLLPFVGQMLASDPNLGFEHDDDSGWFLVDRTEGRTYRSPSDSGDRRLADYAYLGKLPRPDGRGNFLYIAGIHAVGTLGAAHYLVEHAQDLYADVKTRRWSTLVECVLNAKTRTVDSASLLTQVYRHDGP